MTTTKTNTPNTPKKTFGEKRTVKNFVKRKLKETFSIPEKMDKSEAMAMLEKEKEKTRAAKASAKAARAEANAAKAEAEVARKEAESAKKGTHTASSKKQIEKGISKTASQETQSAPSVPRTPKFTIQKVATDFQTTPKHIKEILAEGFTPVPTRIGAEEMDFLFNVLTDMHSTDVVYDITAVKKASKAQTNTTQKNTPTEAVPNLDSTYTTAKKAPLYSKKKEGIQMTAPYNSPKDERQERVSDVSKNAKCIEILLKQNHILLLDASFLLNDRLDMALYDKLMELDETIGKILLLPSSIHELEKQLSSPDDSLRRHAEKALNFLCSCPKLVVASNDKRLNSFGDLDILMTILAHRSLYAFSVFTNDTNLAKDVLLLNQLSSYNGHTTEVYKLNKSGVVCPFQITQDFHIPGLQPTEHKKTTVGTVSATPSNLTTNLFLRNTLEKATENKQKEEAQARKTEEKDKNISVADSLLQGFLNGE